MLSFKDYVKLSNIGAPEHEPRYLRGSYFVHKIMGHGEGGRTYYFRHAKAAITKFCQIFGMDDEVKKIIKNMIKTRVEDNEVYNVIREYIHRPAICDADLTWIIGEIPNFQSTKHGPNFESAKHGPTTKHGPIRVANFDYHPSIKAGDDRGSLDANNYDIAVDFYDLTKPIKMRNTMYDIIVVNYDYAGNSLLIELTLFANYIVIHGFNHNDAGTTAAIALINHTLERIVGAPPLTRYTRANNEQFAKHEIHRIVDKKNNPLGQYFRIIKMKL